MKQIIIILCLSSVSGLLPAIVQAEIYRWTDKEGNVHYGDKPAGNNAQKLDVRTSSGKSVQTSATHKSAKEIADEMEAARLAREKSRKQANNSANKALCESRRAEIAKKQQEVYKNDPSTLNYPHSERFAHSEWRKAQELKRDLEKLQKRYNSSCR